MATGYTNAFITIAPDCPVAKGTLPDRQTSVAGLEHSLLTENPYRLNGDELLFAVQIRHKGLGDSADLEAIRAAFFLKPHACLRASMLPKRYGWGVHYDEKGRIALHGAETDAYRRLAARTDLRVMPAMRNRKSR